MKTYCANDIKAFGEALSKHLQVPVTFKQGDLSTDGKRVNCPLVNIHTEMQFDYICGGLCHELAHVFFKTPKHCKPIAKAIATKHNRPDLESCAHYIVNAVVDIADETRLRSYMTGTQRMLDNLQTVIEEKEYNALTQNKPNWQWFVCAMIRYARTRKSRGLIKIGKLLDCQGFNGKVATSRLTRQAHYAIDKFKKLPARTITQWNSLQKIADTVFETLLPILQAIPNIGNGTGDGTGEGTATGNGPQTVIGSFNDTCEQVNDGNGTGALSDFNTASTSAGSQQRNTQSKWYTDNYDPSLEHKIQSAIQSVLARMKDTDHAQANTQLVNKGARITKIVRSAIDGNCFGNPQMDVGEKLSLGILLDYSSSTMNFNGRLRSIACGFAMACRSEDIQTQIGVFDGAYDILPLIESIRQDHSKIGNGGTIVHPAIEASRKWLSRQTGKRGLVIVTDGEFDALTQVNTQIALNLQHQIKTIVVLVGEHNSPTAMKQRILGNWFSYAPMLCGRTLLTACPIENPMQLAMDMLGIVNQF